MGFKLGDVIVDRLQFGYGAKPSGTPLYALTQLQEATIDITADSIDVTDKDGNLLYRKYTGKKGDVNAVHALLNLAVVEVLAATDAEIASTGNEIIMPMIKLVNAGETLDITDYVDGTVVVNALSPKGGMGKEAFTVGSDVSDTEFKIATVEGKSTLTPPTADGEIQYIVKYKKKVASGAKITVSATKFPKSHELFFKALVVDKCDQDAFRAVIIHIPSFMPSPEFSLALQGGDSQTMDFKGSMMVNACSTDQELFSIYYVDEEEDL